LKHSQFESSDKRHSDEMDFSDDDSSGCTGVAYKKKSQFSGFAKRMTDDFDLRKIYEDTLLKILNEHSREKLTNPEGAEEFRYSYEKPPHLRHLKKTLFLDLDDSLVKVSLYELNHQPTYQIEISDGADATIKVRNIKFTHVAYSYMSISVQAYRTF
jgi:hypothetical protein